MEINNILNSINELINNYESKLNALISKLSFFSYLERIETEREIKVIKEILVNLRNITKAYE